MADLQTSTEYAPINIDDVMQTFKTIIERRPAFTQFVPLAPYKATNTKHEWLEYKKTQKSWTVNGASLIGATLLTLDDTTGIKVGDVLKFVKSTGGSTTTKAKVTAVVSGTDLTITRIFTTDEDILDNSVVYLVSRAFAEKSTEDLDTNVKPVRKFNYTQIFRRDFCLSRTALQSAMYGLATEGDRNNKTMSLVEMQVQNQLQDIAYELNLSAMEGVLEQRVDGVTAGAMGGILEYVESDTASVLDAATAAINLPLLNDAVEQAVSNGADGPSLNVMLAHPRQARKISALNVSGNNPVVQQNSTQVGAYVQTFKSDLAGTNGGALTVIVVDRNFPEDKVLIMNSNNNNFVAMENFSVVETTDKKDDGRSWRILGELTAEFRNANDEAIVITNLGL